jgi:hypothetical protein
MDENMLLKVFLHYKPQRHRYTARLKTRWEDDLLSVVRIPLSTPCDAELKM